MADIAANRKDGSSGRDETKAIDLSQFNSVLDLSDAVFNAIVSAEIAKEVKQDALDETEKPRGLKAIAAAADATIDHTRARWEKKTFGKPLGEMTIRDLVVGLRSDVVEKRRACAEALKEESKADLAQLTKELQAAAQDSDQYVADYAQDCLDKSEVTVIKLPKLPIDDGEAKKG